VNVEKVQPLKVDFRVAEIFLPLPVRRARRAAHRDHGRRVPGPRVHGAVYAIDPLVDEQGRAIVVRAQVDNPTAPEVSSRARRGAAARGAADQPAARSSCCSAPACFARVTLSLSQEDEALWVPEQAIVPEGQGQHVLKVVAGQGEGERVVKRTPVRLGMRQQGRAQVVEGLARGDVVVTAGVQKVRDGVAVTVQAPQPPAAPPAGGAGGAEPAPTAGGTRPPRRRRPGRGPGRSAAPPWRAARRPDP
jgi:membrane fusion protein (multidrug efflux system)